MPNPAAIEEDGRDKPLDREELLDPMRHPVLDVEVAGRLVNLSRPSAYRAAAKGELPTIRMGRRLVVPTAALRKLIGLDV
jgi:hypothetical protein